MAAAPRGVSVGEIRHVHLTGTFGHCRPSVTRPAICGNRALVRGRVAGSAVEVEEHAGAQFAGVEAPERRLNQDVFFPPAECRIAARWNRRGCRFKSLRGRGARFFEELRYFDRRVLAAGASVQQLGAVFLDGGEHFRIQRTHGAEPLRHRGIVVGGPAAIRDRHVARDLDPVFQVRCGRLMRGRK